MAKIFKSETELAGAFDTMVDAMIALDHAWTDERARAEVQDAARDVRHDLAAAIALLAAVPLRADRRRAHAAYDELRDEQRDLAREAYLSVLALGQLVQQAWQDSMAPPRALEQATAAVDGMLDALAPFVTRAETGVRRCLLDGEPLEDVLAQAG
jgi:hypothetical protein